MNTKWENPKSVISMLVIVLGTVSAVAQKPTIEWVDIPAGTFTMGSPKPEMEREKIETQHQVTLSAFKMSKYEITGPRFGRAAGNFGTVLLGDGRGNFKAVVPLESGLCIRGEVRNIVRDKDRLIFAVNDDVPIVYRLK